MIYFYKIFSFFFISYKTLKFLKNFLSKALEFQIILFKSKIYIINRKKIFLYKTLTIFVDSN